MSKFLNALVFNAPDGGAGASGPGAAAGGSPPPSSGAASSPPPSAGTPAAGDSGTPPAVGDGSANGGQQAVQPPAGDWYKPADLPAHLLGKDQNETMDKMAEALKGYRQRDASVPEKVDAYSEFPADLPETVKPHLDTLKGDPLYARVAEKALALKMPVTAYQGLVTEFVSVANEMGLMAPMVDPAAEQKELVPQASRHLPEAEQTQAAERRMKENEDWLRAMAERGPDKGGISKEDAEYAFAMLGDTARGHRFIEAMRAGMGNGQGNGPAMGLPPGGAKNGEAAKADLQRRSALPENTPGHRLYDDASAAQLQADYKAFYGN